MTILSTIAIMRAGGGCVPGVPDIARVRPTPRRPFARVLERQVADRNRGDLDAFRNGYGNRQRWYSSRAGSGTTAGKRWSNAITIDIQPSRELWAGSSSHLLDIESLGPAGRSPRGRWCRQCQTAPNPKDCSQ